MTTPVEKGDTGHTPFNPGEIIRVSGLSRWRTSVGPHELTLDIVPAVKLENGELGIASFVVMEQDQRLLSYAGEVVARAVAGAVTGRSPLLLVTAESKGSHFVPWVWSHLSGLIGTHRLVGRIICLRKGGPKVYMDRPVVINGITVNPSIRYSSITSPEPQTLTVSPRDAELLADTAATGAQPVIIDDFLGRGGTTVGITGLFRNLGLIPPGYLAVIGSDGELYRDTFRDEGISIGVIPRPFPLSLPTFFRTEPDAAWQIR